MGSKTVYYTFDADIPIERVRDATRRSLMLLGGNLFDQGDSFVLKQGVNGVSFAFAANLEAMISVHQAAPNKYEFYGTVTWSPNGLFWVCLIIGFFVFGILWIVPFLYLFVDPAQAYQNALFRIQGMLN